MLSEIRIDSDKSYKLGFDAWIQTIPIIWGLFWIGIAFAAYQGGGFADIPRDSGAQLAFIFGYLFFGIGIGWIMFPFLITTKFVIDRESITRKYAFRTPVRILWKETSSIRYFEDDAGFGFEIVSGSNRVRIRSTLAGVPIFSEIALAEVPIDKWLGDSHAIALSIVGKSVPSDSSINHN